MQRVDVTLPVPASLTLPHAMAWAADQLAAYTSRGWRVPATWVLELGQPATLTRRARPGTMRFRAEWTGGGAGLAGVTGGDPRGRAWLDVRGDGRVVLGGAWPDGVRAQLLAVLGERVDW